MWNKIRIVYHTKACSKPEYARSGIINHTRASNRGAITDFRMLPTDACPGRLSNLSSLLDKKHIKMAPKIIHQRKTVKSRFVLSPSYRIRYKLLRLSHHTVCQTSNKYHACTHELTHKQHEIYGVTFSNQSVAL